MEVGVVGPEGAAALVVELGKVVAMAFGDPSGAADGSARLQAATPARTAMMASAVMEAGCLRSTASSSGSIHGRRVGGRATMARAGEGAGSSPWPDFARLGVAGGVSAALVVGWST